jgi:dolichol-phosphate mannosyltransferase
MPNSGLYTAWKRYLAFCCVGTIGLVVDMGIFHVLYSWLGWPLEISKVLAAESALVNNFFWNDCWTFGFRRMEPSSLRLRRLFRFHVICVSGLLLSLFLIVLMHRWVGVPAEFANVVAILLVSSWNFALSRYWGWAVARTPTPELLQPDTTRRP